MRFLKSSLLLLLAMSTPLIAQTYLPKAVRFDGAPSYKTADLLAASGLKVSGGVTKPEIDAAVQKLADTGLFADTRYVVNGDALVITLKPTGADKMLPVEYGNFVWWQPGELTPLVHARVPLFDGTVPLDGSLLDSVKQALVALLAEKGITGKVESMTNSVESARIGALTLSLTTPEIKVGDIKFTGAPATAVPVTDKVRAKMSGDDFEEKATTKGLVNNSEQIFRDAGYLDIAVEAAPHAAPRPAGFARYEIDLAATLKNAELYHVSGVEVHGAPPVSNGDLQKALQIKAGDVASAYELRTAEARLVAPYREMGYLDSDLKADLAKDAVAHRVTYTLTMVPGEPYHVAAVHTSGFNAEQQTEFAKSFHLEPNTLFDKAFRQQLVSLTQKRVFSGAKVQLNRTQDRKEHTVVVTLTIGKPGSPQSMEKMQ